jgi:TolB-like protein
MIEESERVEQQRVEQQRVEEQQRAARRTLTTLLITVSALFVAALVFMLVRGDQGAPEGRRVLAVLPIQGPNPETGPGRYAGFGEGLAAYFGRADPMDLGVFGPASTSRFVESGEDALSIGRTLGADIILVGRESGGGLSPTLIAELLRVDDGSILWRGEFEAPSDGDRSALLLQVAIDVTEVLDLPR